MAVSTSYAPLTFAGDDATVLFSVTWPFFDGTLVVTLIASDSSETVQTITTHYTVSGGTDSDGLPATGSVTMLTAPASGETLRIERATTKTQTATWTNTGPFQAKTLEATLDKILMIAQENYYNRDLDWSGAWATSTAYTLNDVVSNDGDTYICTAAHTSAAATEPGTGASWTSYWDLFASGGSTGSTGATGASGADGITAGLSYAFDSATSGDPGAGEFLLNNATVASVTAINISDTDADGNDVSGFIATWDDVTAAAGRGHIIIRDKSDTSAYAIFSVSGSNTDNSTYNTITVTHVASAGTFAGPCAIEFYRSGADGGGSGDMAAATYDPASIAEQLVGLTASQTLTNKTLTAPQISQIELGHASDTTITRVSAGVVAVEGSNVLLASGLGSVTQAYDADTLKADTADVLTAGFAATPYNAGTQSSGTYTPDEANGNMQYATNNGAHTLAPPSNSCTLVILYTNGASAGTITTSGFTMVTGDSFDTTNGNEFLCQIVKIDNGTAYSLLHVTAMQ